MDTSIYDISIRVLTSREEGEFVARALELDLLGYGPTEKDAVKDLCEAIKAQLSFAYQQKDDSLIPFPAEREYFDRWEEAQATSLKKVLKKDGTVKLRAKATFVRFSKVEIDKLRSSRKFQRTELSCA